MVGVRSLIMVRTVSRRSSPANWGKSFSEGYVGSGFDGQLTSLSTHERQSGTMRCKDVHMNCPLQIFVPRRNCMPRGRKRPPQDSVDSILLAISRRDNIDPDTLSHYFDRLDEEWTEGARDKVLHLLHMHDPAAHAAAVLILTELATDFDLEELEELVADPTVSDMAKLTLSPVLKDFN